MTSTTTAVKLEKLSLKWKSELESFQASLKQSLELFLLNSDKNCLWLQCSDTRPVSVLVLAALTQLVVPNLFLQWHEVSKLIISRQWEFPSKKLIVCEITNEAKSVMEEIVLKKLIAMLVEEDSQKFAFIAPQCPSLDKLMQRVKIIDLLIVSVDLGKPKKLPKIGKSRESKYASLYRLALTGRTNEMSQLLHQGININKPVGPDRRRLIHTAAEFGHLSTVELLYRYKADLEARDGKKNSPLHFAARNGHFDVAQFLLHKGVNVNRTGKQFRTALHWAAERDHKNVLLLLIANGANKNSPDVNKLTPLELAARNGHLTTTMALLDNGVAVNSKYNKTKSTALHWAAENNHCHIVGALLDCGAKIDASDSQGNTALHCASRNGHIGTVLRLLEDNANVKCKNKDSNLPIHEAASKGHWVIVDIFFRKLNILLLNKLRSECIHIDIRGKCNQTILHLASENAHEKLVEWLLRNGADKNARDSNERTPLHLATKSGHNETSLILLSAGVDVNCKDSSGKIPLHYSSKNGQILVIDKLLLLADIEIEAADSQGWTALHFASHSGCKIAVETLLKHGANVNAKNNDNYTPLHLAVYEGRDAVVKLLVSHGADCNLKNNSDQTPLDVADSGSKIGIYRFLLSRKGRLDI